MDDRPAEDPRVPVAVSACLFGEAVRYDGDHKRHDVLREQLDPHVRWVPLCPEVLGGLGVPRPAIRIVAEADGHHVREVVSGIDRTGALHDAIEQILRTLDAEGVRGFVFKARSPSCGVGDAEVVDPGGAHRGHGDGLAAAAVRAARPGVVVVSDEELTSAAACAAFLDRVRAT